MEEYIENCDVKLQTIAKIRNKTGFTDIIIDTEDLYLLSDYAVSMDVNSRTGYHAVNIHYNGIRKRLTHVLLGVNILPRGFVVDHYDKNPLNMSKQNLRLVTFAVNSQNQKKRAGTTSKYIGVTWNKKLQCWAVQARYQGQNHHLGCFSKENELEAAKTYDRFIIFMYQNVKMFANLTLTQDEIVLALKTKPQPPKRIVSNLGVGIQKRHNKFVYLWSENGKQFSQSFDTFDEAKLLREKKIEEKKQSHKRKKIAEGIQRNSDGVPIILTNSRAGSKHEIMVDEKFYFELAQYNWSFRKGTGDILAKIKSENVNLPYLVLTLFGFEKKANESVDHLAQNYEDCRIQSLRFANISAQIQNRRKLKPGSSKYIGVSKQIYKTKTTWRVSIELEGKTVFRESFASEKDAAERYNIEVKKYYENPKLNIIDDGPDGSANEINTDVIVKKTHTCRKKGNSQYRGVIKSRKKWTTRIFFANRIVYSQSFVTQEEAALAYNIEICKYYTHPELNVVPVKSNLNIDVLKNTVVREDKPTDEVDVLPLTKKKKISC